MKCPKCRGKNLETTCVGILAGPDINQTWCHDCGWKGVAESCKQAEVSEVENPDEHLPPGVASTVLVFRGHWCASILMYEADLEKQPGNESLEKLWLAKIQCALHSLEDKEEVTQHETEAD